MRFDSTRIYQRALELVTRSKVLIAELPPGHAFLADQLRRASSSVVLNFAEGCGKPSRADQRRFFAIARGSAYEVAAALDVAEALGVITPGSQAQTRDLCDHLAAMLTRFGRA
jgi:four helix bundle protein